MALFIVSKPGLVSQLMKITVKNRSNQSLGHLGSYLKSLLPFAQKRMGFDKPPYIYFDSDEQNSQKVLGKTGYYSPDTSEIVIYIDNRHPKDVLRSLSHELVHHTQNCRGDLNPEIAGGTELGYAQVNPHMRQMESEAFEKGNLCMRDWEDSVKIQLQETNYYQTRGDGNQMDKYKQIVETVAKRVATRIKEGNFNFNKDEQIEEVEEIDETVEELDEKRRIRQGNEDRARGDVPADRIREGEESDEAVVEESDETTEDVVEEAEETSEDVVEEVEEIEAGAEINESNDQWYQRNLFENLTKKWAK